MRRALPALLLLLPLATPAADSNDDCVVTVEPDDLFVQDRDLVVPAGRHYADAVALRGDVVVAKGAHVKQAVALGGNVVVEDGAVVDEDAVAIGGDVRVVGGGRVGSDAVSIGGHVAARAAQVRGNTVALGLAWGGASLEGKILEEIAAKGRCVVRRSSEER